MSVPFRIGIDIVSVERMRRVIERQGRPFLNRVFTRLEQDYCDCKRNKFENYAARFAAKEAVIKAKKGGPGRFAFREIEVVRGKAGAPSIEINLEARKKMRISPNARFELTIAHEREFAIACVAMFDS